MKIVGVYNKSRNADIPAEGFTEKVACRVWRQVFQRRRRWPAFR